MKQIYRHITPESTSGHKYDLMTSQVIDTNCKHTTEETTIAGNVIIPTDTNDKYYYSEPTFQINTHNMVSNFDNTILQNCVETRMPSQSMSCDISQLQTSSNILENVQDKPNLAQEIISKISQLDMKSLLNVQEILNQHTVNYGMDSTVLQCQYLQTNPNISPFLPVGLISEMNEQSPDIEQDHKQHIPNNFNLEQVFQVPDTMIGYIFNENTNKLVKVQLLENSEGLQTYRPYEDQQDNISTTTSSYGSIEQTSGDVKIETAESNREITSQPLRPDGQIKTPPQNKNKFRSITAKWKSLRNRSLHSKFVKRMQHIRIHSERSENSRPKPKTLPKRIDQHKASTVNKDQGYFHDFAKNNYTLLQAPLQL